ncbi:hypothetical protein D3C71_1708100 [compost metagenome]
MKVVSIAVVMNTPTATSERNDSRPSPQTPWPLVHPPPIWVPTPTSSPPTTSRMGGKPIREGAAAGSQCSASAPAVIKPSRNA